MGPVGEGFADNFNLETTCLKAYFAKNCWHLLRAPSNCATLSNIGNMSEPNNKTCPFSPDIAAAAGGPVHWMAAEDNMTTEWQQWTMSSGDQTISPSGAFNQIFLNSQMSLHDIEDIILHVCIMSPNLMTIVSCVSIYNIALKLFNVENNVYTITIPLCLNPFMSIWGRTSWASPLHCRIKLPKTTSCHSVINFCHIITPI